MKIAKKLLSAAVLVLALGIFIPVVLYANEVSLTIDGVQVNFEDQRPEIVDGRTLVPDRDVFEVLGFEVDWDPDAETAILTARTIEPDFDWDTQHLAFRYRDVEVLISIGSSTFTVNGEEYELDVPAQVIGERAMLPIRAVLESVGHFVDWDEDAGNIIVRNLWGSMDFNYTPGALENQLAPPSPGEYFAIMHTNFGEIHLRLFPDLAPLTVESFVTHARAGYYDGVTFHRVIDWFMIQGGCPYDDPERNSQGGESIWGVLFGDEGTTNLRHIRGALSMSNLGPHTNRSQFFIVQIDGLRPGELAHLPQIQTSEQWEYRIANQDQLVPDLGIDLEIYYRDLFPASFGEHLLAYGGVPHLDFRHTVFGQVFIGMDVVDAIAAVETDDVDRPLEDVIIERIEILQFTN
ncbi:MAG: peptidylprolyl isomerase [Defluviitaleaceae bacterium]|nr:peptidylprolyl isomerase [Defluviitaleaceae bacterium]